MKRTSIYSNDEIVEKCLSLRIKLRQNAVTFGVGNSLFVDVSILSSVCAEDFVSLALLPTPGRKVRVTSRLGYH